MNDLYLLDNLTPKQKQYVSGLASGLTTLQIAKKYVVSHHTVRNTIAKAKDRVGALSTSNLIAIAVKKEWIIQEENDFPITFKVKNAN